MARRRAPSVGSGTRQLPAGPIGARVDSALHDAFVASQELERRVMEIASNTRVDAQERGSRIRALLTDVQGQRASLSEAWVAAGRPEPLGFVYSEHAERAEWFDGWVEVEARVLAEQERSGRTRAQVEQLILDAAPPFDEDLEAEELGAIYRRNASAPEE